MAEPNAPAENAPAENVETAETAIGEKTDQLDEKDQKQSLMAWAGSYVKSGIKSTANAVQAMRAFTTMITDDNDAEGKSIKFVLEKTLAKFAKLKKKKFKAKDFGTQVDSLGRLLVLLYAKNRAPKSDRIVFTPAQRDTYLDYIQIASAAYSATEETCLEALEGLKTFSALSIHFYQKSSKTTNGEFQLAFNILKQSGNDGKTTWILTVRGTAQVTDIAADLIADSVALPDAKGKKTKMKAHKGAFVSAKSLSKKAIEILNKALKPGDNLLIMGHSLGGGVAGILKYLFSLETNPIYKEAKCFVFAPAATLSGHPKLHKNITCFIRQDDLVPRLSLGNMEHVFRLYEKCLQGDSGWMSKAMSFGKQLIGEMTDTKPMPVDNLRLPGEVVYHLWTKTTYGDDGVYTRENAEFKSLVFSTSCLKDHFLDAFTKSILAFDERGVEDRKTSTLGNIGNAVSAMIDDQGKKDSTKKIKEEEKNGKSKKK